MKKINLLKSELKKSILEAVEISGLRRNPVLSPYGEAIISLVSDKTNYHPSYIRPRVKELEKKGLIKFTKKGKYTFITLTKEGENLLKYHRLFFKMENK